LVWEAELRRGSQFVTALPYLLETVRETFRLNPDLREADDTGTPLTPFPSAEEEKAARLAEARRLEERDARLHAAKEASRHAFFRRGLGPPPPLLKELGGYIDDDVLFKLAVRLYEIALETVPPDEIPAFELKLPDRIVRERPRTLQKRGAYRPPFIADAMETLHAHRHEKMFRTSNGWTSLVDQIGDRLAAQVKWIVLLSPRLQGDVARMDEEIRTIDQAKWESEHFQKRWAKKAASARKRWDEYLGTVGLESERSPALSVQIRERQLAEMDRSEREEWIRRELGIEPKPAELSHFSARKFAAYRVAIQVGKAERGEREAMADYRVTLEAAGKYARNRKLFQDFNSRRLTPQPRRKTSSDSP
jgi:hypothetical protein